MALRPSYAPHGPSGEGRFPCLPAVLVPAIVRGMELPDLKFDASGLICAKVTKSPEAPRPGEGERLKGLHRWSNAAAVLETAGPGRVVSRHGDRGEGIQPTRRRRPRRRGPFNGPNAGWA